MKFALFRSASAAIMILAGFCFASAQELSVEQIIARHRDAVVAKGKAPGVKNQMVLADAKFTFKGSAAVLGGKALILSEGEKNLWGMNFNSNDYPQDRFGFDGKDVRVGRPSPSVSRSLLGEFIYNNKVLLRDGLLGGALSSSWVLLSDRSGKISMDGKKVIDGKSTVVLSYSSKGGSDVNVKIYLDDKTFRHLRTEYTLVRGAAIGPSVDASASQTSTIYKVVEDFSDFAKAGDRFLPRSYKIAYSSSGAAAVVPSQLANRDAEWSFTITNVTYDQELAVNSFDIDG